MAEDDQDRASEIEAERRAEIESEMERVGQDPDQVDAGDGSLGTQSADSGTTRRAARTEEEGVDAATSEEETQEMPTDQQAEQWAESGGDEDLAKAIVRVDEE